uniref:Uncharacterized protein n=1 Tax=Nelumbo nucifera TaxID=4432 RepID=A0A822XGM8_NELNU|nr:TPA_asm: hypothetical protein HUJ06_019642 [Nelumbo nucifera]
MRREPRWGLGAGGVVPTIHVSQMSGAPAHQKTLVGVANNGTMNSVIHPRASRRHLFIQFPPVNSKVKMYCTVKAAADYTHTAEFHFPLFETPQLPHLRPFPSITCSSPSSTYHVNVIPPSLFSSVLLCYAAAVAATAEGLTSILQREKRACIHPKSSENFRCCCRASEHFVNRQWWFRV